MMNHAFLITAHKYPEQLGEIVGILDAPNHYFFIHIDKKSYQKMVSSEVIQHLKKDNCFVTCCITVNWGGVFANTCNIEINGRNGKVKN